jgi:hypothetical protein
MVYLGVDCRVRECRRSPNYLRNSGPCYFFDLVAGKAATGAHIIEDLGNPEDTRVRVVPAYLSAKATSGYNTAHDHHLDWWPAL